MSGWSSLVFSLVLRTIRHPSLGVDLLRVAWRLRRRGWYRHVPFLPVPEREYLRWRLLTAYGDADAIPPAEDVERYARWAAR